MANFRMDDYVDVAERIRMFYEKYPDGSLQSYRDPVVMEINGKPFIAYSAAAYRSKDDPHPGIGWAWEPVPGPTQFTKDSELMNAETAAWGRAIVACGFATKHVASQEEVRSRQSDAPPQAQRGGNASPPVTSPVPPAAAVDKRTGEIVDKPAWFEPFKVWMRENGVKPEEVAGITGTYSVTAIEAWIAGGDTRSINSLQSAILSARRVPA